MRATGSLELSISSRSIDEAVGLWIHFERRATSGGDGLGMLGREKRSQGSHESSLLANRFTQESNADHMDP